MFILGFRKHRILVVEATWVVVGSAGVSGVWDDLGTVVRVWPWDEEVFWLPVARIAWMRARSGS